MVLVGGCSVLAVTVARRTVVALPVAVGPVMVHVIPGAPGKCKGDSQGRKDGNAFWVRHDPSFSFLRETAIAAR
jgi:hypothetical protein